MIPSGVQVFVALAVRNQDRFGRPERAHDPFAVQAPDQRIRDDEAPAADLRLVQRGADALADAIGNPDRCGLRSGVDIDADWLVDQIDVQGGLIG